MFVLKFDTMAPNGLTRIGLQDDMTFVGRLLHSTDPGTTLRAHWLKLATDSEATSVVYGRQDLNSLRTQSCRSRFEICV